MEKKSLTILFIILMTTLLVACGDSTLATAPVAITITTTNSATVSSNPTAVPTTTKPATTNVVPTVKPTTTSPATTAAPTSKPTQNGLVGKIAYNTFDPNDLPEIYVINPDGTGKVRIAQGRSPLFSPDGKQVAFLTRLDKVEPGGWRKVGIYTANLDGSDKKLYCSGSGNAQLDLVRWSPRNRYIIMNGSEIGPGMLLFCNLADGKYTPVFSDKSGAISKVFDWTPDGENALWQAGEDYHDLNLYYGNPDKGGKDAIQLTNNQNRHTDKLPQGLQIFSYYFFARFSPDGKTIAVGGTKIFFISTPGQKSPLEGKVIEGIGSSLTGLAWSPDGKAVAYSDWDSKAVKIVDMDSGKVTTLENTGFLGDWTRQ